MRALIPPGSWELACTRDGYQPRRVAVSSLAAGEHRIVDLAMEPTGP